MEKLLYCECCGQILEKEDLRQIVIKSRKTRKAKTILNLDEKCAVKVRKLKFSPQINTKVRKLPDWFSVAIRDNKSCKNIFLIPEWNIKDIEKFKTPKEKLVMTSLKGNHYYTPYELEKEIKNKTEFMLQLVKLLYDLQTEDEKKLRETKHRNAVGFNKPDADFLTGMARLYETQGYAVFTDAQLEKTSKLMIKYIGQLIVLINYGNAKLFKFK